MKHDMIVILLLILVFQGTESPLVRILCIVGVVLCIATAVIKKYTHHLVKRNKVNSEDGV